MKQIDETWIKEKLKEVTEEMKKNKITIATANEYAKLIEIEHELWNLLYFKLNQEESFLIK